MMRAKRVSFRASKKELDRLFACNRESALVWNSKSELQKGTKGRFNLHSQSIQAVCHKYLFARDSARQAIQKGIKNARYPYKKKKHYNTKWAKDGFRIFSNGKIELSMGIHEGKRQSRLSFTHRICQRDKSKKSSFVMIKGCTWLFHLKMG